MNKKRFVITDTVGDTVILNTDSDDVLIDKVRKIVLENEDYDYSVLGISDAIEYIEEYCDDLKIEY